MPSRLNFFPALIVDVGTSILNTGRCRRIRPCCTISLLAGEDSSPAEEPNLKIPPSRLAFFIPVLPFSIKAIILLLSFVVNNICGITMQSRHILGHCILGTRVSVWFLP
jgi:hypothetical protein